MMKTMRDYQENEPLTIRIKLLFLGMILMLNNMPRPLRQFAGEFREIAEILSSRKPKITMDDVLDMFQLLNKQEDKKQKSLSDF